MYRTLQRFAGQVTWRTLKLDVEETVLCADGRPSGMRVKALAVPGKPPIHLEGLVSPRDPELNVGLRFRQLPTGECWPICPLSAGSRPRCSKGWQMQIASYSTEPSGRAMNSPPLVSSRSQPRISLIGRSGEKEGVLRCSRSSRLLGECSFTSTIPIRCCGRILTERKIIEAAGWRVAWDGMEIRV